MISVMNSNDFDLDGKSVDVQSKPRVSEGDFVDTSDKGGGESVNSIPDVVKDGLCGELVHHFLEAELKVDFYGHHPEMVPGGDVGALDNGKEVGDSDRVRKGSEEKMGGNKTEKNEFCGDRSHEMKQMLSDSRVEEIGTGFNAKNGKSEPLGSRAGKGGVVSKKSSVSHYDSMLSMFDEFAANGRDGAVAVGLSKPLGYGYEIGDMVWGKVKSHPWWPGQIFCEEFASPSVRRLKREGLVLVAFFGDSSYGWFDPAELIPFDSNFAEKSRQTTSRTFVKAVEEAMDEASRRMALGLACKCRSTYNFRPEDVHGYFAVDVGDYEPGAVYSITQIQKARDAFQPRATLDFIEQLALAPTSSEHDGLPFIKNKATVFAYRKAVFEEFDETYAQAFGYQAVRPSPGPVHEQATRKNLSRAPLSGRLVIAETLGKGKSSARASKAKDQAKKEKYIFKRRDEPRPYQMNERQETSPPQPAYVEGSSTIAAGEHVLQKRARSVSIKSQILEKHEQTGMSDRDAMPDTTGRDASMVDKPTVVGFSNPGFQMNASQGESPASSTAEEAPPGYYNSHPLEGRPSLDTEKGVVPGMKEDVAMGLRRMVGSNLVDDKPPIAETVEATAYFQEDVPNSRSLKLEGFEQTPSQPATVVLPREHVAPDGFGASKPKKVKVHKRSAGELSNEKSIMGKKKKRKKDLVRSDSMQIQGKDGPSVVGKVAPNRPDEILFGPGENFQLDHSKSDVRASTSSDPTGWTQKIGVQEENTQLELRQLLRDLQLLALDPFHGNESRRPAIVRQVFLRFRSLVYKKSLADEDEETENSESKAVAVTAAHNNTAAENARQLPAVKPQARVLVRPTEDPTKGGGKRGPSDRQEEMAAKKKKVSDIKNLTVEKKVFQKTPEAARGEGKQTVASYLMPRKAVPVDSVRKKTEVKKRVEQPRPPRVSEPTMLVMKFSSGGSLPSINELKARLARFGPLDHSATRIFWKTFQCRVVYNYKPDAEAAYRFVVGNNGAFGNTEVKCHLREMGLAGRSESEPVKVPREEASVGAQPAVEQQRSSAASATPTALKSCLKKSSGEEAGGNGRGTTRVKFMLGGEESNQLMMIGNKNNFNNNASFADGGASSSHATMDFNSKNFQKAILQPPSLPLPPLLPLPAQFTRPPITLHYSSTEVAQSLPPSPLLPPPPRNAHPNFISTPVSTVDISPQMLTLLTRCKDIVNNVTALLGYMPYHPL